MERIRSLQSAKLISKAKASEMFDALLDESSGDLHYFSDTTCLRAEWDTRLMIFPHRDSPLGPEVAPIPSNTGIITQGPLRGTIITKPGEVPDCNPEIMAHFSK